MPRPERRPIQSAWRPRPSRGLPHRPQQGKRLVSTATATREMFEIIDDGGSVVGIAPRRCCHGNPALVHRTAHVIVLSRDGRILLQKRAADKDIQPGKWDTAVGGHLHPGEDYETAARRELHEEIGLPASTPLQAAFTLKVRNAIESENTQVFIAVSDGPFQAQVAEIDELRFWSWADIDAVPAAADVFTPILLEELAVLRAAPSGQTAVPGAAFMNGAVTATTQPRA